MATERTGANLDAEHLIETGQLYRIGELPPLGEVPTYMFGQLIRSDRYGEPIKAIQKEVVRIPRPEDLKPDEVLMATMASGVNYNNVFASFGKPLDAVSEHRKAKDAGDDIGFHIGGSEASGIVWATGTNVENVKVGDHMVAHCAIAPGLVWGLEGNWGSLAQFSRLKAHQLMPKAKHLTWEQAASQPLDGGTAFRMLRSWTPHTVEEGDIVLVWGASGGLGSTAIPIIKHFGGRAIAVVSSEERGEWCKSIGAEAYINRTDFDYWKKPIPTPNDKGAYDKWLIEGPKQFEKAIKLDGKRVRPKIVFEHTGEDTMPTSMYVCEENGMVVFCGATSGYKGEFNLLRFWTRQIRLQGSHVFNNEEVNEFNNLVIQDVIKPHLSPTSIHSFDQTALVYQSLSDNTHPPGKNVILVGAAEPGLGAEPQAA